jgi:hypothetical protein
MAVSDQDSGGVPMPRAVLLGGLDEALDLPIGGVTDLDRYSSGARHCQRRESRWLGMDNGGDPIGSQHPALPAVL